MSGGINAHTRHASPISFLDADTIEVQFTGAAIDGTGKVLARAWCEATVQRTSEPIDPDETGLDPNPDLD